MKLRINIKYSIRKTDIIFKKRITMYKELKILISKVVIEDLEMNIKKSFIIGISIGIETISKYYKKYTRYLWISKKILRPYITLI